MSTITINKLIKQGEELKLSLIPIPNPTFNTHTWQSNENRSTYNEWSILVTRFLEQNYPGDLCNQKWTSELRNFSQMSTWILSIGCFHSEKLPQNYKYCEKPGRYYN